MAHSDPSLDSPPLTQLAPFRTRRNEIDDVLTLKDFERFVFVMSILERYPERECSLLLGCSEGEIRNTRSLALEHFIGLHSSSMINQRDRGLAPNGAHGGILSEQSWQWQPLESESAAQR
jgi:hypothetical protein